MRRLAPFLFALALGVASIANAGPTELIGSVAPDIRARPLEDDGEVGLDAYRGREVVLAFVAKSCGACRRAAPEVGAGEQMMNTALVNLYVMLGKFPAKGK